MTTPKTPEGWKAEYRQWLMQRFPRITPGNPDWSDVETAFRAGRILGEFEAAAPAAPSAEGVGSDDGNTLQDERSAFEAAMRVAHPEWAFTADPVFDYHNERTRCAWEGWQAARAAPTAPAGGEAPAEASDAQLMIVAQEMGLWCEAYTAPRESGVATELDITPEDAAEFNAASLKDIRAALKAAGLYTHPSADLRGAAEQALEALTRLSGYAMRQTCSHDETYRGGVIWEICCACGAKWADDEGGKPSYEEPPEVIAARAAIASLEVAISRRGKTEHPTHGMPGTSTDQPKGGE